MMATDLYDYPTSRIKQRDLNFGRRVPESILTEPCQDPEIKKVDSVGELILFWSHTLGATSPLHQAGNFRITLKTLTACRVSQDPRNCKKVYSLDLGNVWMVDTRLNTRKVVDPDEAYKASPERKSPSNLRSNKLLRNLARGFREGRN